MKKILIIIIIVTFAAAILYVVKRNDKEIPTKIAAQVEKEEKWLEELNNNKYTIDNPYIVYAPYESNQLSAYIAFDYNQEVKYEYTVNGDIPFTYTSDNISSRVIIPVVALYAGVINDVNIRIYDEFDNLIESTSVELSTIDNTIEDTTNQAIQADVEAETTEFYDFMNNRFVIDNFGNIYDANGAMRANNIIGDSDYGYLKVFDNTFYSVARRNSGDQYNDIYSFSIMGRIDPDNYFSLPMDGVKFHHDFTIGNGKLYALASYIDNDDEYVESLIAVFDLSSHKFIEMLDISDFYVGDQVNMGSTYPDMHFNSIDYYEKENELILNSRSYDAIIAIDATSFTPEWMIKDPDSVSVDNQELLLTPIGDMVYPSGEHTAFVVDDYIPAGDKKENALYLSVFDNRQCVDEDGNSIYYDWGEAQEYGLCTATPPASSRGIIYEIDLNASTVSVYKTIDFQTYSTYKGGFNILENGYKTTYVANENSFEIYNEDDEYIGRYILGLQETATSEDVPFLYRAVSFTSDTFINFVEINE